jgi:hypothetical protein
MRGRLTERRRKRGAAADQSAVGPAGLRARHLLCDLVLRLWLVRFALDDFVDGEARVERAQFQRFLSSGSSSSIWRPLPSKRTVRPCDFM